LAERVSAVQTTVCASDLQALIVEDREIRRLQPRYNTQRSLRRPRAWLRLAAGAGRSVSKRPRALPRLSVCDGPLEGDSADKLLGPFRNEAAAESARQLARELFDLDRLRHSADAHAYLEALQAAWAFLQGAPEAHRRATNAVRNHLLTARRARDHALARRLERLLARVLAYDIAQLRVPADPRQARFALARPAPGGGVEVFVLEAGILVGQAHVPPDDLTELLARPTPCTDIADRPVVLRWLGAQRSPARLVYLGNDGLAELLEAVSDLLAADA
jgi:hypothetical protein